ncbi:MAG: hypothetical protein ACOCRK_00795 [bacterium]
MVIIKVEKEKYLLCKGHEKLQKLLGEPKRIFKKRTCIGRFCDVDIYGPIYIYIGKNNKSITCIINGEISCTKKVTFSEIKNILEKKEFI